MSRVLLTPRWLALHVLAIALVVACGGLSYWQFLRAEAGNGRSIGYALQWPGFGVFVVGVWFWLARDAARAAPGGGSGAAAPAADPVQAPPAEPAGRVPDDIVLPPAPSTAAQRAAAGPSASGADPTGDDELAAFNRLLARLHERDST